jgi:hypothetical protein
MFQFSRFALLQHTFSMLGCPIRISADHVLFANPRSFSQLITSFFASESLGIPRVPFLTFFFLINLSVFHFFQVVKELLSLPL